MLTCMGSSGLFARLRRMHGRFIGRMDVESYRKRGCVIGGDVHLGPNVRLDPAYAWMITIEDGATLGPNVLVLAHDGSVVKQLGVNYFAPVSIGERAFVGANAVIMPGVTIGPDAVVAAGSVVTKDVPAGSVVVGVPARVVNSTERLVASHRARMVSLPVYPLPGWSIEGGITRENMREQRAAAAQGAYVEAARGRTAVDTRDDVGLSDRGE